MPASSSLFPVGVALTLATMAIAGGGDSVFNVLQSAGETAADAYAANFKTGAESSEGGSEDLDAMPPMLPISSNQSANASVDVAYGSGYGSAGADILNGVLSLSADAGADAYGDGFKGSGSGSGSAALSLTFTVLEPIWAEISLGGFTEMGGGNGAEFSGAGIALSAYDYDEVAATRLLAPGAAYTMWCSAGAGASDFDGLAPSGSSSISVEPLIEYEGYLSLGDNAFDTAGASGTFDMTGDCDPGTFGDDTIESPEFHLFVPPRDGTYTFSTCNQTTLDTRLAISLTGPVSTGVIACGDEAPGCAGYTTEVTVDLLESLNYTVVLGSTFGDTGSGTLTVSLAGDLNFDGNVNGGDIGLLIGAWGTSGPGDLNGDGTVDSADLGLILGLFTG